MMNTAADEAIRDFLSEGRAVLGCVKEVPEETILCWLREYKNMWCLGLALVYVCPNHAKLLSIDDLSTVTTFKSEESALSHFINYSDDKQVQEQAKLVYHTLLSKTANSLETVI